MRIFEFLEREGLIHPSRRQLVGERCRDAEIQVFRDSSSGVIYLDPDAAGRVDAYYAAKDTGGRSFPRNDMDALDTQRRSRVLAPLISGKRWADFGCGPGYQFRHDADSTSAHLGVELNDEDRLLLTRDGFNVTAELADVKEFAPQVVSLFHVAEHLMDAEAVLAELGQASVAPGWLVVEVPHGRDWLISHGPKEFREFTFWSEHLVLHTRESITRLLAATGWTVEQVVGVQRYPVWNHLGWLTTGKPTGMSGATLDVTAEALAAAYDAYLAARDCTDTLMVVGRRTA